MYPPKPNYRPLREQNPSSGYSSAFYQTAIIIIIVLLALTLSIWALVITYQQRTNFKARTDFFNSADPTLKSYFNIPCTNDTLGNETKTFSGKTHLVSSCPQTSNVCSEFLCGTDGYCTEQVISGGECFTNSMCGLQSECDLDSCACVASMVNTSCTSAENCPQINFNPCQEAICSDGMCSYNLTAGSECSSTAQCGDYQTCLSNCTCADIFHILQYTPTFTNSSTGENPYDLDGASLVEAVFEDKVDWVTVSLEITADAWDVNVTSYISFDFSLPILADTAVNGVGVFVASSNSTADPTGALTANGYAFVQTTSTGRVFSPNTNYDYTGPNSIVPQFISVALTYKKA